MFDYGRFAQLALDQITDKGFSATLRRRSTAAADPAKPWEGPVDTYTQLTSNVLRTSLMDARGNPFTDTSATGVYLIPAQGLDFQPAVGDELNIGGGFKDVVDIQNISPSITPILIRVFVDE